MSKTVQLNPFEVIPLKNRWYPDNKQLETSGYDCLIPPLVGEIRKSVYQWREQNYKGLSETTSKLMSHWFPTTLDFNSGRLNYFFAQREAVETVIYLYEAIKVRDKMGLIGFSEHSKVTSDRFIENWTRYVIKMATGSGKTKVLSLLLAWSFFHKHFESESTLSKNFLVVAPNIIVLNRLKKDFDNLCIFKDDPIIPEEWRHLFNPELHIQDEVRQISQNGNIFLTNIHRVFLNEREETKDEKWLGPKPKPNADRQQGMDLGKIVRSKEIKDIVVFNDEAHHIHDKDLQWFQSIQDINSKLLQQTGKQISVQIDLTATPKHNTGEIFVQTVSDFPLVEAQRSNIVKQISLPDSESRAKLTLNKSDNAAQKYSNQIEVGVVEWRKHRERLDKSKTPLLFVMTEDTNDAEQIAEYLEAKYEEFKPVGKEKKVLVIHTNKNGDPDEKRSKDELDQLRRAVDAVDSDKSPYLAIVSVLMLREGWDVRNVTTIIGLRQFDVKSGILPEQAIGRGLRKMFPLDVEEELAVVGTDKFIKFVESIKDEGVVIGERGMGKTDGPTEAPIIVELDRQSKDKVLEEMDILLPILGVKFERDYQDILKMDVNSFKFKPLKFQKFSPDELKKLRFINILGDESHKIEFKPETGKLEDIVAFYAKSVLKEARMPSGFKELYPVMEKFVLEHLFGVKMNPEDKIFLMNLSRCEVSEVIFKTFKEAIEHHTLKEVPAKSLSKNHITQLNFQPMPVSSQKYVRSKKSLHTHVVGNEFEKEFALFLDRCPDVVSFVKLYERRTPFKLDYVAEEGKISNYFPDFLAKAKNGMIYIAETKGIEDENAKRKCKRLELWCKDANTLLGKELFRALYVKQDKWKRHSEYLKKIDEAHKIFGGTENE